MDWMISLKSLFISPIRSTQIRMRMDWQTEMKSLLERIRFWSTPMEMPSAISKRSMRFHLLILSIQTAVLPALSLRSMSFSTSLPNRPVPAEKSPSLIRMPPSAPDQTPIESAKTARLPSEMSMESSFGLTDSDNRMFCLRPLLRRHSMFQIQNVWSGETVLIPHTISAARAHA